MRRRLPLVTAITLSVIVVGLAIASGWLGVVTLRNKDEADQRAKAIQSARQMGVNLMTLDKATAQRDTDRIVDGATGEFKNTLAAQAKTVIDQLTKTGAKSTLTEINAAVVSIDGDSAEVMVSLDGIVTNPKVKDGVQRSYRYLMDLERVGDRWLVSDMEMVP
jgi:Mce-associated membrane protein